MDDIRFDGEVAIVTGAGGGLGRTYALELARRGASVVVNDLGGTVLGEGTSQSAADRVVAEIAELGGSAVANYDSVDTAIGGAAIVQAAVDSFGSVDVVINNAGIVRNRSFHKLEPEELSAVMNVHLHGAFYVTQPAFRVMRDKGYGRLLFTSSAGGIWGNYSQSNYGAAKMGLVGLSNVLAIEGSKHNIHSNVIAPIAATRMTDGLMEADLFVQSNPSLVMPLAVYLVSRECEVTHEVFSAGAGQFARIFTGLAPGWRVPEGRVPKVEDVRAHLAEIRDIQGFHMPLNVFDELDLVLQRDSTSG